MLTKDTKVQERQKRGDSIETQRNLLSAEDEATRADFRAFERSKEDPTNAERQKGRQMSVDDFGAKLRKVVPEVSWAIHPYKFDKSVFMIGSERKHIVCGEYPVMPEWSVLTPVYEDFPAHSPITIPSKDGIPIEVFHPGIPLVNRVPTSFTESRRGWRTVLMRFILDGLASLPRVERVFGVGDRASWAYTLKMYEPQPGDLIF